MRKNDKVLTQRVGSGWGSFYGFLQRKLETIVTNLLSILIIGYNFKYINMFIKNYSEDDVICAEFVRDLRLNNLDVDSTTREDMIIQLVQVELKLSLLL